GIKVNEDPRQQELIFKILQAFPELVSGYWSAVNLTLEPRLSSRWITNIPILGTIIFFPVPTNSFTLPNSQHINPSPPALNVVLGNAIPSVLSKNFLTKGLQSASSLVQHSTALPLSKCLAKLDCILSISRETASKLEEDEENGQWLKRIRELEAEAEKRVPEFTVIVGMVQQKPAGPTNESQAIKMALLTEAGLRLLWFYHKLFPRLVSSVKFDAGKLLLNVFDPSVSLSEDESMDVDKDANTLQENSNGMDVLRQLHVLRLLKESDQFGWLNKFRSSAQTNLHRATGELTTRILGSSILFSHDTEEITLWLHAIPETKRALQATTLDETPLADEVAAVLVFLDDCIQRCSKTPYRYLEESVKLFDEAESSDQAQGFTYLRDDPKSFPSPLLMTMPLAIVTSVRKLVLTLATKLQDLRHVWTIHAKLEEILIATNPATKSKVIREAINRETQLLANSLRSIEYLVAQSPASANSAVETFLEQVEELAIPSSSEAAAHSAFELIDWIRLLNIPLNPTQVKRLFDVVVRFCPSAVKEFMYQLDPTMGQFWSTFTEHRELVLTMLPFELAQLHSSPEQTTKKQIRDYLVSLFFSDSAWNTSLGRRMSFGLHRLASAFKANGSISIRQVELSLLRSIFQSSRLIRTQPDLSELKRALFSDSSLSKAVCFSRDLSPSETIELARLVNSALYINDSADQAIARASCSYWLSITQSDADFSTLSTGFDKVILSAI
ncbi:hypothetical protein M422DRAFT_268847, partial [Sphaerobolus stellatus SS14]